MKRFIRIFFLFALAFAGCTDERRLSTDSPEALAAYTEGVSLWERFYYPEAAAAFHRALKADSTFAMAQARLAILSFGAGDEAEAKAAITVAGRLAGRATEREQLFIRMWDRRISYASAEAERLVDSLLARYPGDPEALVFKGGLLELRRRFEEAIGVYRRAVEADSTYAPAVMMLGYAYSGVNEQEKALAQMDRYIRLVPDAADPRASYADLLLRVGRYDEALAQYRKSLELKPDYWYSINQIGVIYALQGRLRAAEQQYNESYRFFPPSQSADATLLATRAGVEFSRGHYDRALELYRSALQKDTASLNAALGMVYTYAKAKKIGEAEEVAAQIAAALERRNMAGTQVMMSYHLLRAYIAMQKGDFREARTECETALDGSSPLARPTAFRLLAEIHVREGLYDEALDACSEALSINANAPSALLTLVRIYRAKGDTVMTREIGNRLLALWKDADADFQDLQELRRLLAGGRPVI